ncbi:unnamed protein product [Caenorhabditis bovis]|uniref:Uncharacterized protein n=1 Tax=Caenorhabditis bovis TaxID=2654633 RepID=A0A8S1ER08_9PELO|nr:unnamed protein product [Caenorhabditis bovis]
MQLKWVIILISFCFSIVFSQSNIVEIQIPTATWLSWSDWSTCSDECGSCGVQLRTRTCLTTEPGCSCQGSSTGVQYCNLNICRYPRTTCCNNFRVTTYQGKFACLSASTVG